MPVSRLVPTPARACRTLAPMVGAIAAGNCIMLKPGSYSPACSHTISRLVQRYLDPDCVKVAEGDRAVTNALLEERFDKICFTGSGYVGQLVLEKAAKHLTPCILELGGSCRQQGRDVKAAAPWV